MRRRGHLDANHRAIGDAAQQLGASVISLAGAGSGCPDLLIGWRGANYLWECKRPNYRVTRGVREKATRAKQEDWALRWTGQYAIVTSADEAIDFLHRQK